MKFYPADWQADVELRFCSLSARGLWLELLCIMQKAEPEGYLLVGGKPPSTKKLALLCGAPERQIKKHLHELENAGVFSRDEAGNIYSRRILRDTEKAKKDSDNGRSGGNPKLRKGVNPPVNPGVKAQRPEARDQRLEVYPTQEEITPELERETGTPFDVVEGGKR